MRHQPGRPAKAGAHPELERAGFLGVEQFLERSPGERGIVEREAGHVRLPFVTDEQAGGGGAFVLHRLDEAAARLAHAQRIAGAPNDLILRIEIGGVGLDNRRSQPGERGTGSQCLGIHGRDVEFQFDFMRHRFPAERAYPGRRDYTSLLQFGLVFVSGGRSPE